MEGVVFCRMVLVLGLQVQFLSSARSALEQARLRLVLERKRIAVWMALEQLSQVPGLVDVTVLERPSPPQEPKVDPQRLLSARAASLQAPLQQDQHVFQLQSGSRQILPTARLVVGRSRLELLVRQLLLAIAVGLRAP